MRKLKNKIYRKYEDFFSEKDLKDPDQVQLINLTIADFDARGYIENPRAPCVVTTIDPDYIKDARAQRLTKKFRIKTDILRLRDITRKRFMIYSTHEMHLEKKREEQFNEYVYQKHMDFYKFAEESLAKMEADAFNELKTLQDKLRELSQIDLNKELNAVQADHQLILGEVRDVYSRFLYLLKLISYFDDIVIEHIQDANDEDRTRLTRPPEITDLEINDKTKGTLEVEQISNYMNKVVRPYLSKRNHLNPEIWQKGYEQTRQKIFNYNRRFTNLALLNHIVTMIHDKFEKTYAKRIVKPIMLGNSTYLSERMLLMKQRATEIMNKFEKDYKRDKMYMALNALVPVILGSIQPKTASSKIKTQRPQQQQASAGNGKILSYKLNQISPAENADIEQRNDTEKLLQKVEKIQDYVLTMLNKFDALPTEIVKKAERSVRRRIHLEKEKSRRALVRQNRMQRWREHLQKHELERLKNH